jgi:hypothetical protein
VKENHSNVSYKYDNALRTFQIWVRQPWLNQITNWRGGGGETVLCF